MGSWGPCLAEAPKQQCALCCQGLRTGFRAGNGFGGFRLGALLSRRTPVSSVHWTLGACKVPMWPWRVWSWVMGCGSTAHRALCSLVFTPRPGTRDVPH